VRNYSLGMRQRLGGATAVPPDPRGLTLRPGPHRARPPRQRRVGPPGLAPALRGAPEVLIPDEPATGLDPAGIRWMRDLLRGFADKGGTVLLSSHLLREIEIVADDIVMIGH